MSKKDVHIKQAETMFVIYQMTLKDIAARLSLSYKTVCNWSKDEHWEEKRASALSPSGSLHADIIDVAKNQIAQMRVEMQNGNAIDLERFNGLSKLLESAQRSLKYEREAPPSSKKKLSPGEQSQQFVKQIRGILKL